MGCMCAPTAVVVADAHIGRWDRIVAAFCAAHVLGKIAGDSSDTHTNTAGSERGYIERALLRSPAIPLHNSPGEASRSAERQRRGSSHACSRSEREREGKGSEQRSRCSTPMFMFSHGLTIGRSLLRCTADEMCERERRGEIRGRRVHVNLQLDREQKCNEGNDMCKRDMEYTLSGVVFMCS